MKHTENYTTIPKNEGAKETYNCDMSPNLLENP